MCATRLHSPSPSQHSRLTNEAYFNLIWQFWQKGYGTAVVACSSSSFSSSSAPALSLTNEQCEKGFFHWQTKRPIPNIWLAHPYHIISPWLTLKFAFGLALEFSTTILLTHRIRKSFVLLLLIPAALPPPSSLSSSSPLFGQFSWVNFVIFAHGLLYGST